MDSQGRAGLPGDFQGAGAWQHGSQSAAGDLTIQSEKQAVDIPSPKERKSVKRSSAATRSQILLYEDDSGCF